MLLRMIKEPNDLTEDRTSSSKEIAHNITKTMDFLCSQLSPPSLNCGLHGEVPKCQNKLIREYMAVLCRNQFW